MEVPCWIQSWRRAVGCSAAGVLEAEMLVMWGRGLGDVADVVKVGEVRGGIPGRQGSDQESSSDTKSLSPAPVRRRRALARSFLGRRTTPPFPHLLSLTSISPFCLKPRSCLLRRHRRPPPRRLPQHLPRTDPALASSNHRRRTALSRRAAPAARAAAPPPAARAAPLTRSKAMLEIGRAHV